MNANQPAKLARTEDNFMVSEKHFNQSFREREWPRSVCSFMVVLWI